jgi:hypothetical protein
MTQRQTSIAGEMLTQANTWKSTVAQHHGDGHTAPGAGEWIDRSEPGQEPVPRGLPSRDGSADPSTSDENLAASVTARVRTDRLEIARSRWRQLFRGKPAENWTGRSGIAVDPTARSARNGRPSSNRANSSGERRAGMRGSARVARSKLLGGVCTRLGRSDVEDAKQMRFWAGKLEGNLRLCLKLAQQAIMRHARDRRTGPLNGAVVVVRERFFQHTMQSDAAVRHRYIERQKACCQTLAGDSRHRQ